MRPSGKVLRSSTLCKLALTALALNGVPSWKRTPSRRWKVYSRPSGEISQRKRGRDELPRVRVLEDECVVNDPREWSAPTKH